MVIPKVLNQYIYSVEFNLTGSGVFQPDALFQLYLESVSWLVHTYYACMYICTYI